MQVVDCLALRKAAFERRNFGPGAALVSGVCDDDEIGLTSPGIESR